MPCYHPLDAYKSRMRKNGKHQITFSRQKAHDHEAIKLPCGQCVGCRLEKSRQWAMRCIHEAQLYENNCFITLTFAPEHLEKRDNPWSVDVRDFQLFMKRLRFKYGSNIRFFHCGEYGEKNGRPHYHACIFNFDFPDKELWKKTETGCDLYISQSLQTLWPYGFSTIGEVTFESAAYCARYIMKKINGKMRDEKKENGLTHYEIVDPDSGEIRHINPEYTTMSRRPGIGRFWMHKYMADVYPHDYVVINGVKCRPPRYYDGVLETTRPYEFDEVKENRLTKASKHDDNNTPDRLLIREKCQNARLKLLPRTLE